LIGLNTGGYFSIWGGGVNFLLFNRHCVLGNFVEGGSDFVVVFRQEVEEVLISVVEEFELIVNIPKHYSRATATDGYLIRRKSIDLNIPLITNVQVARIMAEALGKYGVEDLKVKGVDEYF